jgi:hypothetical protein
VSKFSEVVGGAAQAGRPITVDRIGGDALENVRIKQVGEDYFEVWASDGRVVVVPFTAVAGLTVG